MRENNYEKNIRNCLTSRGGGAIIKVINLILFTCGKVMRLGLVVRLLGCLPKYRRLHSAAVRGATARSLSDIVPNRDFRSDRAQDRRTASLGFPHRDHAVAEIGGLE